jgi:hypothetical protein
MHVIYKYTWKNVLRLDGYRPKGETRRLWKFGERFYLPASGDPAPVTVYDVHEHIKWQEGRVYAVQTGYPPTGGLTVGSVELLRIRLVQVNSINDAGALAEGFNSIADFAATWNTIHGAGKNSFDRGPLVWVLRFNLYSVFRDIVDQALAQESINDTQ